MIEYESNNVKKLFFEGKVTKFIKDQARVICKKLISFGLKRYEYKQIDGKVTKALIVVKNVLTIDDPVVEVIANKRGRHTLAEAALKLDKLQQTQKNLPITLPIIDKRSSTRNKKTT